MKVHCFITNRTIQPDGTMREDGKEPVQKELKFGEYTIQENTSMDHVGSGFFS